MRKIYAATELPENEWQVLDALVLAHKEGETPTNSAFLKLEYASVEDLDVENILIQLHSKGLTGREIGPVGVWIPTPRGIAVVEFAEKTAKWED